MGKKKDSYMHVFTQPTKDWISHTFAAPTAVQQEAWPVIDVYKRQRSYTAGNPDSEIR